MILFAADISQLEDARAYISKQGFTSKNVAIKRKGDDIYVVTKDGLNPWTRNRHLSLSELSLRNRL